MLKEYAVEPTIAAQFQVLSLISALFDYRNPRRISRFPRKWESLVCDEAGKIGDLNKTKVVEKLRQLKEKKYCLLSSSRDYDGIKSWVDNAKSQNSKTAFTAVLTEAAGSNHIGSGSIDEFHTLLACQTDYVVSRNDDNALINVLRTSLQQAKEIIFIDPHINFYTDPSARRYKQAFEKLFNCIRDRPNNIPFKITLCISEAVVPKLKNAIDVEKEIQTLFSLASGQISVTILPQTVAHNRYVLTDVASFSLGDSLWYDSNQTREDHIAMMSHENYLHHKNRYLNNLSTPKI